MLTMECINLFHAGSPGDKEVDDQEGPCPAQTYHKLEEGNDICADGEILLHFIKVEGEKV